MDNHSRKIERIKKKILNLGPFLPGSLSKQLNVCGTPGCKCRRKKNPQKHGPYYQLSFSVKGKSSTLFIKKEDLPEVRKRQRRFKKMKELVTELTQANIDFARQEGVKEKGEKDE